MRAAGGNSDKTEEMGGNVRHRTIAEEVRIDRTEQSMITRATMET